MIRKNIWLDDDIRELQNTIQNTPEDYPEKGFILYKVFPEDKYADIKEERKLARKFLKGRPLSKYFYHWF
jgi:hypothetical protein